MKAGPFGHLSKLSRPAKRTTLVDTNIETVAATLDNLAVSARRPAGPRPAPQPTRSTRPSRSPALEGATCNRVTARLFVHLLQAEHRHTVSLPVRYSCCCTCRGHRRQARHLMEQGRGTDAYAVCTRASTPRSIDLELDATRRDQLDGVRRTDLVDPPTTVPTEGPSIPRSCRPLRGREFQTKFGECTRRP